ncbi:MAG: ATP-binding protein [Bernardetiaceae bacterium]
MNALKLKIPSLLENVRIVESFIDNAREQFQFDDDIYGNIMVAVTESVNNAILHGNRSDKNKNVHLSLIVDQDQLLFRIRDEGNGFNYKNLPDPTAPENLLQPGGRGIFLIQHLADECRFFNNGSTLEIAFKLQNSTNGQTA